MSARVIPFPPSRRVDYVARQAARVAELSHHSGEHHLRHQLRVQREAMERRGIDPQVIERELRSLEAAIRCRLWHDILTPGDSA